MFSFKKMYYRNNLNKKNANMFLKSRKNMKCTKITEN